MRIAAQAAPVRQQVEEALRFAIANGALSPGQRLIERDLCERLGVSRASVREAMRQLETEGLVLAQPNRGPVVAVLTRRDVADVYGLRAVLEAEAARLFCVHAGLAEMEAFSQAARVLADSYAAGSVEAILDAKATMFSALFDGAGNRLLPTMLRTLTLRITALRRLTLGAPGRLPRSAAEVRRLVRAVERRDAVKAVEAATRHVHAAQTVALRNLVDSG